MIICAAIKFISNENPLDTFVMCGLRHGNIIANIQYLDEKWWRNASKIQGFIDHRGIFMDRLQAFQHALECGQLSSSTRQFKEERREDELFSEDLY